jgi:hypothetical protein
MCPKLLKLHKNLDEKDVIDLFGAQVNKNGYKYISYNYLELITRIESLWMIVYQNPFLHVSQSISKGMAKGISCERKNKTMNWALFVAWNNHEQVCISIHVGVDV